VGAVRAVIFGLSITSGAVRRTFETRFNSLEGFVSVGRTKQVKLYGVVTNPTLAPGGKCSC
jgi:hypothetical protein